MTTKRVKDAFHCKTGGCWENADTDEGYCHYHARFEQPEAAMNGGATVERKCKIEGCANDINGLGGPYRKLCERHKREAIDARTSTKGKPLGPRIERNGNAKLSLVDLAHAVENAREAHAAATAELERTKAALLEALQ